MSNSKKLEKTKRPKINNWNKSRQQTKTILNQIDINYLNPDEEEVLYNDKNNLINTRYE